MLPFIPKTDLDLSNQNIFVSRGKFDQMIPFSESEAVVKTLHNHNAQVIDVVTPGGHEITYDEVTNLHDFVAS